MQTRVTLTNTTSAIAVLSYAEIVRVLGLAVAVDAGLRIDAPGTLVTVDLDPAEAKGEFTSRVAVLIDHNFVAPEPEQSEAGVPADRSLNSGDGAPATPPVISSSGLLIPGAPAPAAG